MTPSAATVLSVIKMTSDLTSPQLAEDVDKCSQFLSFYSASALLAMKTAVLARAILSVCLSVHPSVSQSIRHIPVFCRVTGICRSGK